MNKPLSVNDNVVLRLEDGSTQSALLTRFSVKHARGNIRVGTAADWFKGALGPYGAAYLR